MKHSTPSTSNSFPVARQCLVTSALILLFGTATVLAQTSGSSSTSGQKNTGSTYGSGSSSSSTANPDVNSTRDINSQRSSTGAGAMTGRETTSGKLSWGDKRFVTKAADDGKDEVNLAELAAQRATNSEVRSFAQKLASDHEAVNSELTQIASQKNVKIDQDNDKDRAYKRLSKKTGADFDQEFVEHMIDEHEKDIKMFEKAASDSKDADVRAFASKHVDHLRDHLQQAQNLRATLMPTGRMDTSSGRTSTSGSSTYGTGTTSSTPSSSSSSSSSTPDTSTTKRDTSR